MAGKAEDEFVVTPVLRDLVAVKPPVAFAEAGSIDEREAKGVVVGLVGAVFAIGKNRGSIRSAFVSEIKPLVGRNLEFLFVVVGSANRADVPVVSGFGICGRERKSSF